jgi:hypothetical protein
MSDFVKMVQPTQQMSAAPGPLVVSKANPR